MSRNSSLSTHRSSLSTLLTPSRLDEPELLDEDDAPREDMERSLRDLRRFNRYCGGISIYKRMMRRAGNPQSILDIGTGTSDLLESVNSQLRVGLDIKIDHLLRGDDKSIRKVIADARRL